MLKFEPKFNGKEWVVRLDGKVVGEILETSGGFHYVPKGSKTHGSVFPTAQDVKRSLMD